MPLDWQSIASTVAAEAVIAVVGGCVGWVVTIVKQERAENRKTRRDLDAAFVKIRALEDALDDVSDFAAPSEAGRSVRPTRLG